MKKAVIKQLVDLAKKNLGKSLNEITGLTAICDKYDLINCTQSSDGSTYIFIFGDKVYKINNGQTELPSDKELVDEKDITLIVFDPTTGIRFNLHMMHNLVVTFSCVNSTKEFAEIWLKMLEHLQQEA